MPEFAWKAARADGELEHGRIEAPTESAALKRLRDRGLTPLQMALLEPDNASAATDQPAPPKRLAIPFLSRATVRERQAKGPVNAADVLALTSELSIMLRAGLALDNALRVLIGMSHKTSVVALTQSLLDEVKGGAALSRALGRRRELFGDFYINMVRSGEASGQISSVMERLVEHMERLRALRESVVSAALYPAILLVVSVLSLIGMLGFVVPQFEKLFTDMGDALPLPTRLVMHLGKGFQDYGLIFFVSISLVGWFFARWIRKPGGRAWWQARLISLPLIGNLLRKYELTLFARSLGTLLGNGVPLLAALQIATDTVGNQVLKDALSGIAPAVKGGRKVADAVATAQIFEPLGINLIRVGEETGRLGTMVLELANILNREVETGIKRLLTLLEPLLIMFLGLLIASIIVSILLGILSINDLAV